MTIYIDVCMLTGFFNLTNFYKLYLIFFLSGQIYAQPKILNLSLKNPELNILYVGIENKLKVEGVIDIAKVRLSINDKFYYPQKDRIFYVSISTKGKTLLKLYKKKELFLKKPLL